MLALASASQGLNPTLVVLIIAAVVVAAFWRAIVKVGIAAIIVGFLFLVVSGALDVLHAVRAFIP